VPRIINHRSKQRLLTEVPQRLQGYSNIPREYRPYVLVLVDRDGDDCKLLKSSLENAAAACGLVTRSVAGDGPIDIVNRIVVEELEAWHFGDMTALAEEFPGVPANLTRKAQFRDPDAIAGGTHEALLRELKRAGHFKDNESLPKIETARRMAARVNPERCRSRSFQSFCEGLRALVVQLNEAA
jgi:hypothetical protein